MARQGADARRLGFHGSATHLVGGEDGAEGGSHGRVLRVAGSRRNRPGPAGVGCGCEGLREGEREGKRRGAGARGANGVQIGRASCRERVFLVV